MSKIQKRAITPEISYIFFVNFYKIIYLLYSYDVSLWDDCLAKFANLQYFPLAPFARSYRITDEPNPRYGPSSAFLMNIFFALKGSKLSFLFVITAAGVVPCGGRKKSLLTHFSADYILILVL